jgi:hypothetical protein
MLLLCLWRLQCEMFTDALKDVAEQLLQESGHIEKPAAPAARTITVYKPLPRWGSPAHTGNSGQIVAPNVLARLQDKEAC